MKRLENLDFVAALTPSRFMQLSLQNDDLDPEIRAPFRHYYRQWNGLASNRLSYWYDRQLEELLSCLEDNPRARILDAGCGTGSESLYLSLKGGNLTSIDVSEGKIAIAKARLAHLRKVAGHDLSVTFQAQPILATTGQYDFIWLEQAFHHMEPRTEVVAHLAHLLVPGGRLFFSEANGWNPLLQANLVKLRGFETIKRTQTSEGELVWGDERILPPLMLQWTLEKAGLKKEKCRYYRIFPSSERFDRFFNIERQLSRFPAASLIAPLYSHYNFVAIKAE